MSEISAVIRAKVLEKDADQRRSVDVLKMVQGLVFDLDGTVALHDKDTGKYHLLPGAADLFQKLQDARIPFLVFTNGTGRTPEVQTAALKAEGLNFGDGQLITPSSVAADYFIANRIRRVLVIGTDGVWKPLEDAGIEVFLPAKGTPSVDAVYVGWTPSFSNDDLDCACQKIWDGASFYVSTDARFFANQNGKALGISGAVAAGIHHVTQKKAEVLGKPSAYSIEFAARLLEVPVNRLVVVGDDPVTDIEMALANAAMAIGVTTGVTSKEMFMSLPQESQPHAIVEGLDWILPVLGR